MVNHFLESEWEHLRFPFSTGQRLVDLAGQRERAASSGNDLYILLLVCNQLQPQPDVCNTLRLVNDEYFIAAKDSINPGRGHLSEKPLYVDVIAVHPHHALLSVKNGVK